MTALQHSSQHSSQRSSRPPASSRSKPSLRAVAPANRRVGRTEPTRRRGAGLVAGALLFAVVLGGNVSVHASTTQGQFDLERLRASARQREAKYQQLRLEVAELQAPGRIVAEARRLGMVEPAKVTYLTPTVSTSSADGGSRSGGDLPAAEAAQSWGQVKPHLGPRR